MPVEIFQRRHKHLSLWPHRRKLVSWLTPIIISTVLRETNGRRLPAPPVTSYRHRQRRPLPFQNLWIKGSCTFVTGSLIEILVIIGVTPLTQYQARDLREQFCVTAWVKVTVSPASPTHVVPTRSQCSRLSSSMLWFELITVFTERYRLSVYFTAILVELVE